MLTRSATHFSVLSTYPNLVPSRNASIYIPSFPLVPEWSPGQPPPVPYKGLSLFATFENRKAVTTLPLAPSLGKPGLTDQPWVAFVGLPKLQRAYLLKTFPFLREKVGWRV